MTRLACYLCAGEHELVRRAASTTAEITVCEPCSDRWKLRTLEAVTEARMIAYSVAPEPHTLESWPPRLTWGNR